MEQLNIGLPEFKIANLFEDVKILKEVQNISNTIIEEDPELKQDKNKMLKKLIDEKFNDRIEI